MEAAAPHGARDPGVEHDSEVTQPDDRDNPKGNRYEFQSVLDGKTTVSMVSTARKPPRYIDAYAKRPKPPATDNATLPRSAPAWTTYFKDSPLPYTSDFCTGGLDRMRTIILSDTHVSAGPLDDCDPVLERHLTTFVRQQASLNPPVQLVLNGDFLDFVQAPPYHGPHLRAQSPADVPLCFTESQSCNKLDSIALAHPALFHALADLLSCHPDNALVILPGNHDPDFFWPRVRTAFSQLVQRSCSLSKDAIRFHLERIYHPPHLPRVWIEHGHQYDNCNKFAVGDAQHWSTARPPIFRDSTDQERLLECLGTQFLIRFLNRLEEQYPFVDNVKPFSRFLRIFAISALHPQYGTLRAAAASWSVLRFLAPTTLRHSLRHSRDVLSSARPGPDDNVHPLLRYVQRMRDRDKTKLCSLLKGSGISLGDQPLEMALRRPTLADECMMFLAEQLHLPGDYALQSATSLLGAGHRSDTLGLGRAFLADESAILTQGAQQVLRRDDADLVIMGHTHEPLDRPGNANYYNTGCWVRNFVPSPDLVPPGHC